MKFTLIVGGVLYALFALMLIIQLSSWTVTFGNILDDDFVIALYWTGIIAFTLLNLIIIPAFMIIQGNKHQEA